jgi:FkbM family methyltransferase
MFATDKFVDFRMASSGGVKESEIRLAYLMLLDREPDAEGLKHYNAKAAAEKYSIADLRNDIRSSQEYRRKKDGEIKEIDVGGVVVVVDPRDPEFGSAIAKDGTWEPHIVSLILENLREGAVFVDIGANVGVMSFKAAAAVGSTGKVISFEPNPRNVQLFLRGVRANNFHHVTLLPFAASAYPAIFPVLGGSNSFLGREGADGNLVQGLPADEFLLSEPRIDLIKIDIEGHEPYAMSGLGKTLAKHRPYVLCEFNPRCLRDHFGAEPRQFADEIFAVASRVEIIEHSGHRFFADSADALMASWDEKNKLAVEAGLLPDGMLHFDLLFRPTLSS